ncbi:MAG: heme peroxidase, partial [Gammaproteobacteria bacterium]|nr:heme peroxidase [Gammaproteobacteria bacterium]
MDAAQSADGAAAQVLSEAVGVQTAASTALGAAQAADGVADQALTEAQDARTQAATGLDAALALEALAQAALTGAKADQAEKADFLDAAEQTQQQAADDLADAQAAADNCSSALNAAIQDAQRAQTAYDDAVADSAAAQTELQDTLDRHDVTVDNGTVVIPNVATDAGQSAPFSSFMTLFGQFFDHGLDLTSKGGSGTVFIPLQPDDPLYVDGSPTNFMVLTRATNQPGEDGILGTADDVHEHVNRTTPFIDLNQVYTSHESHQVFLREYALNDQGRPVATGRMLAGENGGPPTWADIKEQARTLLGIELSDGDVGRVPLLATDLYGNFIPGANGFPQLVTATGLVQGNPAATVAASTAIATGHAFLEDIAHNATPAAGLIADDDAAIGTAADHQPAGTYDNELLDAHFVVGDGRGNENIGLTAVHHVFHSEHNNRVDQIKEVLLGSGDVAFLNEWLLTDVTEIPADIGSLVWDGERLFQAARFSTEMVYQHLVFDEFARTVSPNVDPFVFSNTADIDPAIVSEFANVVYRFGHSMLTETVDRLAADGQTAAPVGLIEAFLNPMEYVASGIDSDAAAGAIVRGMTRQVGNEIDEFTTGALRSNLL